MAEEAHKPLPEKELNKAEASELIDKLVSGAAASASGSRADGRRVALRDQLRATCGMAIVTKWPPN
ncbi:hypothetical protein [Bradyrhizobium sp. Arg816]|uniref:hypothetical protein n=1 Tax=Bradyrhizobium sp. Arg816 TaxID=2998491 RepID=UPI00249EC534|nr:hypothetical protein [Bradyrhizobium sp. Arg816]MDI3567529.1 hypothetical protein [Bradyrhizobium sp. Arg816]